MAITFHCGHCGKSLTTSDDKAGLKAKCPGCGEVITVPDAESGTRADADDVADEEDWEESDNLPAAPAPERKKRSKTGSKTCPMCGAENSPRAKTCVACGEELPIDEEEPRRRRRGPRANIEVGEVMSDAWETFKANFGIALAGQIIFTVLIVMGFVPLLVLIVIAAMIMDQGNGEPPIGIIIGAVPALLVALGVVFYLMPGIIRFYISIARQDDVELTTIFKGGPWFLSYLWVSVVYGLAMLVATAACIFPAFVLAIFAWPILYVVCDSEPGEGNYWSRTLELSKPNWVMSLLLMLIIMGINFAIGIAGAIPCIGAIISLASILIQPYFQLLWATAYVKMSGQD